MSTEMIGPHYLHQFVAARLSEIEHAYDRTPDWDQHKLKELDGMHKAFSEMRGKLESLVRSEK